MVFCGKQAIDGDTAQVEPGIASRLEIPQLTKKWLQSQLNSQNIKGILEVFYAGLDNTKKLHISKKDTKDNESHGKYGIE